MQGFILKATASPLPDPGPAGWVGHKAGSSRPPISSFNGKRVSHQQFHRATASTAVNGKDVEDAFWKNKRLPRRKITTTDVLAAYGNDRSSLRGGFFLQKLCLQNILHDNRKITPDQVIQEFIRDPDRNNKYKLAIARFKAECCLRGLPLNGQPVTTEAVARDCQAAGATLELARFSEQCCLKGLPLYGQLVTPDDVVKDYQSANATLELARFRAECCLRGLALNGQPVTTGAVVEGYLAAGAMLELARFKSACCLKGLALYGRLVTPDVVVKNYLAAGGTLELARFKADCCLRGLALNGRLVTPDVVVKDYLAAGAMLELARFMADCCLRGLALNGQPVTPEAVVKSFPDSPEGKLGMARFKEQCCLRGLVLEDQQVTPDDVVKDYLTTRSTLEIARLKEHCCLKNLPLNGQPVTTEAVVRDYRAASAALELARFMEKCCLKGLALYGRLVTPEAVIEKYLAVNATLELVRFRMACCLKALPFNGRQITPDEVARDFHATRSKLELARFKEQCCLKNLPLNGQPVSPEAVVEGYLAVNAELELARFREQCCLRILPLYGQKVTPEAVVAGYQAARATLELARFKEQCCLRDLRLNGQKVTPEAVVKDFRAVNATLELAHFKAECCLRGIPLNGQQVTPEGAIKDFLDSPEGKLGAARFKAECCLRSLSLDGRQVTPEAVVKDYQAARATLELSHFREACCLRGLPLNGHRVTPDAVARDFPDSREGKLGLARFKAECCLRGLRLNNQPVTVEAVVKDYQANRATLELARFMEQCCLKGLLFNGQLVTPEMVVKCFQQTRATLELVRFKEQCCLRGLSLNGFQVTPDEVAGDLQAVRAPLELARFMEQCCLKGWLLHGQPVTPDTVDMGYERGGWLLERAYFYSRLALNARELNGSYLDNRSVLAAFDEVPGNHASRQAEYLMQRLGQSRGYDETDEAQEIIEKAWQIVDNVSVRDEQRRLQCLLKFMAMQNQLTIDHQGVSPEQVLQSIKTLRHSYQNLRIHFFFLAHCYITRQFIDGQKIHKEQVLECLRQFPEGSKLRRALGHWFEQCGCEVNVMDTMLLNSGNRFNNAGHGDRSHLPDVIPRTESTGRPAKSAEVSVANPFPRLNALVLKTLEIIQEINSSFSHPPILITGSYARFLQHRCSSFNDIDIICTVTESAKTLFAKLQVLNTGRDSEIPQNITIWPVPGCQEINLPKAYNINLKDGDLGMKAMGFQVSVDDRVTHGNEARLAVHVPGVERPVWHLSFAEETRLLNDTLEYLADNLDLLTELLQTGMLLDIPRTILFNTPKNTGDRIYGLLMRCLLTLNKARQFIALHSDGKPEYRTQQLQKEQQRLHALTEILQKKLSSHACRNDFVDRVNGWLSTAHHFNEYEIKRKDFIKALLALIQPE